jgi:hypothetical protein
LCVSPVKLISLRCRSFVRTLDNTLEYSHERIAKKNAPMRRIEYVMAKLLHALFASMYMC